MQNWYKKISFPDSYKTGIAEYLEQSRPTIKPLIMKATKYLPDEFMTRLQKNEFTQKFSVEVMIKISSDNDKKELHFIPGKQCGKWISVPLSLIHEIEYLYEIPCRDHNHPFVRIYFNEPEEGNAYVRVLLEMLQKMKMATPVSSPPQYFPGNNNIADEFSPAYEDTNFREMSPAGGNGNSQCHCISYQRVCVPRTRCHRVRNRTGGWTTICTTYNVCTKFCSQMDCWDGDNGSPV